MRPEKNEFFIATVRALSLLGTCQRAKVGALIVRDGRIISTGYNGSPPDEPHCLDVGCDMVDGHCVRTTHAEANAICFAAKSGVATAHSTMWVYGWDGGICHRCYKLCLSAGIEDIMIVRHDGDVCRVSRDGGHMELFGTRFL